MVTFMWLSVAAFNLGTCSNHPSISYIIRGNDPVSRTLIIKTDNKILYKGTTIMWDPTPFVSNSIDYYVYKTPGLSTLTLRSLNGMRLQSDTVFFGQPTNWLLGSDAFIGLYGENLSPPKSPSAFYDRLEEWEIISRTLDSFAPRANVPVAKGGFPIAELHHGSYLFLTWQPLQHQIEGQLGWDSAPGAYQFIVRDKDLKPMKCFEPFEDIDSSLISDIADDAYQFVKVSDDAVHGFSGEGQTIEISIDCDILTVYLRSNDGLKSWKLRRLRL